VTLFLETSQTLIKSGIHLKDLSYQRDWESKSIFMYYTEFITDLLIQIFTLGYYLSILVFIHSVIFFFS